MSLLADRDPITGMMGGVQIHAGQRMDNNRNPVGATSDTCL